MKNFLFGIITALFLTFNPTTKIIATLEQDSYVSQDLKITVQEFQTENQRYWIAEIIGSDHSLLRGAMANDKYDETRETVSSMAHRLDATLAINASGFQTKSITLPVGIVIRNGKIIGTQSNTKKESLAITPDGDFEFYKFREMKNIESLNIENTFTFGPVLLRNGEKPVFENKDRHPRTALGQIDKHHYLIVVVDGRVEGAIGMTFQELQDIFVEYNCINAYNLDGGGSSTLYFKGEVINRPTDGRERLVPDMLWF